MGRKPAVNYQLLTNQSLAANFISPVTSITTEDNVSYQIDVVTTDSTGTFTVQASNNYEVVGPGPVVVNAGTWFDLPLTGTPAVAAANDTIAIEIREPSFNAYRLKYTSTVAGTGVCSVRVNAKTLGA
jgi:hypothetical protein